MNLIVPPLLALGLVVALAAAPRPDPGLPAPQQHMLDSLAALADSAWDVPPGLNRQHVIDFMRRLARSPDSIYAGPDSAHRSDAEMKRFFEANEARFTQLVTMFEADSTTDRVDGPSFFIYRPPGQLPAKRQQAYDEIMGSLGIRILERGKNGLILFRTTTVHTFDRRGYAFSRAPVHPVVEHETLRAGIGITPTFRRIKGNWYTYYQAMT